ncbi:hypothetical protein PQR39_35595 [Paraburkholderia sediminicola]|uniref:hypothetical protein n=1 Tax=Paraburkholderia sediminicola TaxID=458836 RepID=UPI0038B783D5
MLPSELLEKIRALEHARKPTPDLIHAVAVAAAECLAKATGGKVDIALHGLVIISRAPASVALKQKVG